MIVLIKIYFYFFLFFCLINQYKTIRCLLYITRNKTEKSNSKDCFIYHNICLFTVKTSS